MLVISRKAEQEVFFPNLGITVSVLQVRGRIVKIGVNAPKSVKVLRQDANHQQVAAAQALQVTPSQHEGEPTEAFDETEHRRRNELNVLSLKLASIQRRIDRGDTFDPEATLRTLLENVTSFDHDVAPVEHAQAVTTTGRRMRLLVVEDCDNERRLMAYLLANHGFDVHVARDGMEALEQLQLFGFKPDVVLMDMQMPLSDGLQTLHVIREDERLSGLKVFAVTGSPRVIEDEPVGHSWDEWFEKPLNVGRLISRLKSETAAEPSHSMA